MIIFSYKTNTKTVFVSSGQNPVIVPRKAVSEVELSVVVSADILKYVMNLQG